MRETDNKFMAVIQNSFLRKPYGSEITLRNARNCMIKREERKEFFELQIIILDLDLRKNIK